MLFIWLFFFELAARLWGVSLAAARRGERGGARYRARGDGDRRHRVRCVVAVDSGRYGDHSKRSIRAAPRNKARDPSMRARTMLPLVRNVLFVSIMTIAGIVTAANLGINVTPLLAGAGVIGLAIGFGAQSLVTDLITGLFIIIEDTISVGDWIDVDGGHAGTVEHLSIRTVRLRDGQGAIHAIPFSQIKIVKNLSRDFAYAVFEVRVSFSADVDRGHATDSRSRRRNDGRLPLPPRDARADRGVGARPFRSELDGRQRADQDAAVAAVERGARVQSASQAQDGRSGHRDSGAADAHVSRRRRTATGSLCRTTRWPDMRSRQPHEQWRRPRSRRRRPRAAHAPLAVARDVSHEPRPAPPPTGQTAPIPPQIPTAGEAGGKS